MVTRQTVTTLIDYEKQLSSCIYIWM